MTERTDRHVYNIIHKYVLLYWRIKFLPSYISWVRWIPLSHNFSCAFYYPCINMHYHFLTYQSSASPLTTKLGSLLSVKFFVGFWQTQKLLPPSSWLFHLSPCVVIAGSPPIYFAYDTVDLLHKIFLLLKQFYWNHWATKFEWNLQIRHLD